jgi:ABC-2 type transport system ATP-binding protein
VALVRAGATSEVELAPAPRPVVDLAGVTYSFGSGTGLADLDLAVPAGSITVLVGPNGAGKTTALRMVTGALAPHAGAVRVFGFEPSGPHGEEVRRRCGVVAAKPALYDRLTGRDNLRYAAELFDLGSTADRKSVV